MFEGDELQGLGEHPNEVSELQGFAIDFPLEDHGAEQGQERLSYSIQSPQVCGTGLTDGVHAAEDVAHRCMEDSRSENELRFKTFKTEPTPGVACSVNDNGLRREGASARSLQRNSESAPAPFSRPGGRKSLTRRECSEVINRTNTGGRSHTEEWNDCPSAIRNQIIALLSGQVDVSRPETEMWVRRIMWVFYSLLVAAAISNESNPNFFVDVGELWHQETIDRSRVETQVKDFFKKYFTRAGKPFRNMLPNEPSRIFSPEEMREDLDFEKALFFLYSARQRIGVKGRPKPGASIESFRLTGTRQSHIAVARPGGVSNSHEQEVLIETENLLSFHRHGKRVLPIPSPPKLFSTNSDFQELYRVLECNEAPQFHPSDTSTAEELIVPEDGLFPSKESPTPVHATSSNLMIKEEPSESLHFESVQDEKKPSSTSPCLPPRPKLASVNWNESESEETVNRLSAEFRGLDINNQLLLSMEIPLDHALGEGDLFSDLTEAEMEVATTHQDNQVDGTETAKREKRHLSKKFSNRIHKIQRDGSQQLCPQASSSSADS